MVRETGVQSQVESLPKTFFKMVLDTSLLNTQYYKVHIKGKVEQSRECSSTLPLHLGLVAVEKGAFRSPLTKGRQLYFYFISDKIINDPNNNVNDFNGNLNLKNI